MTDVQLAANEAKIEQIAADSLATARTLGGKLSPGVLEAWGSVEALVTEVDATAGTAAAELDRLSRTAAELDRQSRDEQGNPSGLARSNPAGLARAREKVTTDAEGTIIKAVAASTAKIETLRSQVIAGAIPEVTGQESAEAREEAAMLLAGTTNVYERMIGLARGSDRRLAAVVAGSWGLAKLGGDAAMHNALRMAAAEGSRTHGTASQKAHAEALDTLLPAAMKSITTTRYRAAKRLAGGRWR